jgi:hypothetical protein
MEICSRSFRIRADNLSGIEYIIPGTVRIVPSSRRWDLFVLAGLQDNLRKIRQTVRLVNAAFLFGTADFLKNHNQQKYPRFLYNFVCFET